MGLFLNGHRACEPTDAESAAHPITSPRDRDHQGDPAGLAPRGRARWGELPEDLNAALREHCPNGIDVYFDNVGGDQLEAALNRLNTFARVPLCGMVSAYNLEQPAPGPRNLASLLVNRATITGFIVTDHYDRFGEFIEEVGGHVRSGELGYRETVVDGIENMPQAFIGLMEGQNTGKMLVRVGPDPA